MPAPEPLARELREAELAEDPRARAARLASQRWVTQRRLWAAIDREGITEPGAQARFIASRLWPDLRPDALEQWVAAVREQTAAGHPLRRPTRAADVVGDDLERLMVEHGYAVTPRETVETIIRHEAGAALREDRRDLAPDSTADLPLT